MGDAPEGSVIITPAEVYREVQTLTREVRDLITTDKAEQRERAALSTRVDRLEAEVGSIKQKLWFVAGLASASGAGVGSILAPLLVR